MPNTHLDTLDKLFGDIDELTSDYQKQEYNPLRYDGDLVTEPQLHTDRSRHLHDLMYKVQLILPGTIITDTEFISSGYGTLLLPDVGPYKTIELQIQPVYNEETEYEFHIRWGGFSELIYTHDVIPTDVAIIRPLVSYLGSLWKRCYNGRSTFEDWRPHDIDFSRLTCKDITSTEEEEEDTPTTSEIMSALYSAIASHSPILGEFIAQREAGGPITLDDTGRLVHTDTGERVLFHSPGA